MHSVECGHPNAGWLDIGASGDARKPHEARLCPAVRQAQRAQVGCGTSVQYAWPAAVTPLPSATRWRLKQAALAGLPALVAAGDRRSAPRPWRPST
jgi:hypothetical protein